MAFLGIISFGGIFAGINPSHTHFEILHAFQTADVKAFIVEPHLLPVALQAASQANIPHENIFVFDYDTPPIQSWNPSEAQGEDLGDEEKWNGLVSWRTLLRHGECDWVAWDDEQRSKDTTAARLFSSGTTGLPKAVEMTHHNFVAQHTLVMEYKAHDYEVWIRRSILSGE
jgi:4-coumarate--CoA ligase